MKVRLEKITFRFRDTVWLLTGCHSVFWLLGGGTAGSHWCHSPVYQPDRRTIGPHVVVRKLSVSPAAAAHDIIQDQVWSMHTQNVSTKSTAMSNLEI